MSAGKLGIDSIEKTGYKTSNEWEESLVLMLNVNNNSIP